MRKMMGFVLAGAAAFVLTACSGNNAQSEYRSGCDNSS